MLVTDMPVLHERLNELADALGGKRPTPAGMKIWIETLREFPVHDIVDVLTRWAKQQTKAPAPAEVWKALNARRTDRLEEQAESQKRSAQADGCHLHRRSPALAAKVRALSKELSDPSRPKLDPKEWASMLLDRFLADRACPNGQPVSYVQIQCACQALKIHLKDAFESRERQRAGDVA